jgi:FlaA1/EpsC-like NDP-sugar epimerase
MIIKFLSERVLPRFIVLTIDMFMIMFSCIFIYLVRYSLEGLTLDVRRDCFFLTLVLMLSNLITFMSFRTYKGILRFSSFSDLVRILYSLVLGYTLAYIAMMIIKNFEIGSNLTNVTFIAIFLFNTLLMIISRILIKEVYESIIIGSSVDKPVNVFIYGTKQAGVSVAKALKGNKEFNYRVTGFISDESHMVGKELLGVMIHANDEHIFDTLERKDVKAVIVSPQKMDEIKNSNLLANFVDHNISLLTTVPINEWNGPVISKKQLKDIQIEDLLPRAPIHINMREIASNIEGKRLLVTGAAGSIGSEIVRQVASFNPYSITLVDQAETPLHEIRLELQEKWRELHTEIIVADVSNKSRMEKVFSTTRPYYVFHAAAYKHVPMMEDNVSEAIQTNVLGTKIIADLSVKYNVQKFVMISTDKAVNPSNVMGCSKRICEIYVQSLAKYLERKGEKSTQFITTRFGNVLGSNGSVIPLFKSQIKNGGPVTVTHPEIIRYFMTIPEACQLVLEAGAMGKSGELYIFDMGKPVKILDLAKRMIRLSGSNNIKIEFTGLRHGEKLYEELLNKAELTKPTHHEKIMIADVREYEYEEVSKCIEALIQVSYDYDDMKTVRAMKDIVPEYQSINSPFEAVDIPQQKASNGPVSKDTDGWSI